MYFKDASYTEIVIIYNNCKYMIMIIIIILYYNGYYYSKICLIEDIGVDTCMGTEHALKTIL